MITSIGLLIMFFVMIIKPDLFCQAMEEKTRGIVIKIMRIAGVVGLVSSVVILAMQLTGMAG